MPIFPFSVDKLLAGEYNCICRKLSDADNYVAAARKKLRETETAFYCETGRVLNF